MTQSGGTVDTLLRELVKLMAPLQTELGPTRRTGFFAELGIPLTQQQADQLANPVLTIQESLVYLMEIGGDLDVAIATEDWLEVAELSFPGIAKIADLIEALSALSTTLETMSLPPSVTQADIEAVPGRLVDGLLVRYLARNFALVELLEFAGLLERTDHNITSTDPDLPFYTVNTWHFDRIGDWLSDPGGQLAARFGFGTPGFDGTALLQLLDKLIAQLGYPVRLKPGSPPELEVIGMKLKPRLDLNPRGLSATLAGDAISGTVETGVDDWKIGLNAGIAPPTGTEIVVQPNGQVSVTPPAGSVSGDLRATWKMERPAAPVIVLGQPGASRVELQSISAYVETQLSWKGNRAESTLGFGGEIEGGKVLINAGEGDGFLQKILSGLNIENDFAVQFGYTGGEGLHFRGSSSLAIQLASHIDLGPVDLTALTLTVGITPAGFPIAITTDIKAELGPLVGLVEGIGFEVVLTLAGEMTEGDLGPFDVELGFVPPRGAGLSLNAGAVTGGGYVFFDPDNEEYAGALELEILGLFSANAIGLITTRLPDGSQGFSLLIIISVEFTPPFQLGWGFTLNAVGGLVGLNRTMALDKLREGVRTNSIASVMFPQDVIANAPRIISDLREIFPPEEGKFLIGPMAKLGWGTPSLITLSLGVIIEIPGNIAIVGILRIALPSEDVVLINLQVNFVGTLDFDKKMLTFDASLYESRILWITLEGDMAVRLKWGDPAAFLLSVGGFHPQFEPPPLDLPSPMKRISASILDTSWGRIRIMQYQAVTSNTVQFGAKAELYFGFSEFYVDGHLGFDALFQFNPFKFIIEMSAGLTLHVFGADVLSIRLRFSLQGPTPWRAKGRGSVTILLWDIDVDFDETWGDREDTTLPSVAVLPRIVEDLSKPSHWKALPPSSATGLWVALRPIEAGEDDLVLHPAGSLTVTEKVVPLAFKFDRVGSEEPSDVNEARIASAASGAVSLSLTPVQDKFPVAQYKKVSGSEALSAPSFQPFECGKTLTPSGSVVKAGTAVHRQVQYEVTIVDKEPGLAFLMLAVELLGTSLFTHLLGGSAVARSPVSMMNKKLRDPFDETIAVRDEPHTVVFAHNNKPVSAAATFAGDAMAKDHMAATVAANPALAGQLQVVPAFEVAAV